MASEAVKRISADRRAASFFAVPHIPELPVRPVKTMADVTAWMDQLSRWNTESHHWRDKFSAVLKPILIDLAQGDPDALSEEDIVALLDARLGAYIKRRGDTMTGPLGLNIRPTAPTHAVALQDIEGKVNRDGDTMTGFLTLYDDPEDPKHAVTLRFLQQFVSGVIGLTGIQHRHNQIVTSNTWTINHNRNKYPSGAAVLIGSVPYDSETLRSDPTQNQTVLEFSANYTGTAILTFS